jgi:Icc-related predicted phosphoesterase
MRALILGDFHGKLSENVIKKMKLANSDIIFSSGDFCGNEELGKLYFKEVYGKNENSISKKIKDRVKFLEKKSFESGLSVLRKLSRFGKPVFAVMGNWDPAPYGHDLYGKATNSLDKKLTKKMQYANNNIFFMDMKFLELPNFIIIGGTSSTSPGILSKEKLMYVKEKYGLREFLNFKKNYAWREKIYIELFKEACILKKKTGKIIIFLTHNCPYNTKLDKINLKTAPKKVRGQHFGSYLERKMIERFQPDLVLCGHMHENPGRDKIKKSQIINPGSVLDGKFVVIDF